ncbi:uncharacterized protein EI90DRAFT_3292638 [Cantharellus anzutake]|uniref:uncharacterized protein n=1 Tax=Cantharellus anzutake TaxID=1750568 RepID=UPI00190846AF|nr:uncharacterized protein EI90DRAFT_3292638 [Cantharellus anzutake]KAF8321863.1 hypothetical protein EI90DRAFT_3292638 [Cantharellus anzutake]
MAKSIHSEFAKAEVGKHVSTRTLSPPTLHIMPLGKKCKRANNLGKYSQKKLHVDPSPTTESIHTIPLEHTQTVGDDVLPDWPDANVNSNSYDGANSDVDSDTDLDETINPAISSKNAFSQCLHDTEGQLAHGRNSAITQIDLTQGEEEKETCSSEAAESNVFVAEMEMHDISPDDQQSESTWSPTHSPADTP